MRGVGYVALIVVLVAFALMCSRCPNVSIGGGPSRPGVFKGSTGWNLLTPVTPEFGGNPLLSNSLWSTSDFDRNKYLVSSNFSIRIYPGGQVPEIFGVKLYVMFQKLEEYTPSGGLFSTYPSEYHGTTYLRPVGTPYGPDEVIEQTIGGKKVYLLKFFDYPPDKWLATDAQDRTYFFETT